MAGDKEFNRLENVVLSKIKEFIPHFLVKILSGFHKVGYGSIEFYG